MECSYSIHSCDINQPLYSSCPFDQRSQPRAAKRIVELVSLLIHSWLVVGFTINTGDKFKDLLS
jgi:hypothetical protein